MSAAIPGLRAGDPDAIRKVRAGRDAAHLDGVLAQLDFWLPTVRRMRPAQPWGDVVRVLNRTTESTWTVERLRRTVRRLVSEGIVEATLLDRAPRQQGDDRLIRLVAGIAAAAPDRTLQQIAAQLEAMRERTPRGGTRWHPSSVKHLLGRAEKLGLAGDPASAGRSRGLAIKLGRSDRPSRDEMSVLGASRARLLDSALGDTAFVGAPRRTSQARQQLPGKSITGLM